MIFFFACFFYMACTTKLDYDTFFKIRVLENGDELLTGISYTTFYQENFFWDAENIKSVKIKRLYCDKSWSDYKSTLILKNGKIISEEKPMDDSDEISYSYDERGRLMTVKFNPRGYEWIYTYPESNTRETWLNGQYYETASIFPEKRGYRVMIINKAGSTTELIFKKEKGLLINVKKTHLYSNSSLNHLIREYILEYDNGQLNSIKWQIRNIYNDKKDVRSIATVTNRENKTITEVREINYRNGEIDFINKILFSDYDGHKNWHKAEVYMNDKLYHSTTRDIEYMTTNKDKL